MNDDKRITSIASIESDSGEKVIRITKEKIVPPSDYEILKAKCEKYEKQNKEIMRFLYSHKNINFLDNLVKEYKKNSKQNLEEIVELFSVVSFSEENLSIMTDLIDYLNEIIESLKKISGTNDIQNTFEVTTWN